MLSLDVSDGFGPCQCELCEGTTQLERGIDGSLSEHVWAQRIDKVATYTARLDEIRSHMTRNRENVPSTRALPRMPSDLNIDGKLDDVFWKQTRDPRLTDLQTGKNLRIETRFHIAWAQDGALCLGVRCEEPDMEKSTFAANASAESTSNFRRGPPPA